jgi:hypothetical protein
MVGILQKSWTSMLTRQHRRFLFRSLDFS